MRFKALVVRDAKWVEEEFELPDDHPVSLAFSKADIADISIDGEDA